MTEFSLNVIECVRRIPRGQVASYGQIAALAGKPQGSRGVSWILHSSSKTEKLPWHRVLGSTGKISFPKGSRHFHLQKSLLEKEGITVDSNGAIDLVQYRWSRKPKIDAREKYRKIEAAKRKAL